MTLDDGDVLYLPAGTPHAAEVKQVALEHGLMSAYTAFVAVDSSIKTAGDHGTSVAVPVPVPVCPAPAPVLKTMR